ncbi:MAG: hypothetical protein WAO20_06370 [Acidobacteriota bacterium]
MRIRLQILLGVLPVFLVLGLVVATLNYTTRREEIRLALSEEVFTLTVAMSEFLSSDLVRSDLAMLPPHGERLRAPVERLMQENPIRSVRLYSLSGNKSTLSFGEAGDPSTSSPMDGVTFEARREVLYSSVLARADGQYYVGAVAPLKASGKPFGLLLLDIDATPAMEASQKILLHSIAFLVGILGCGLLVSWMMGGLVTGAVRELSRATEVVAKGRYDWRVAPGWLRELNDLSNTFNTMTSLLEEILSKTKRAVIEGEQFRRPEDLAECFSESLWNVGHTRLGSLDVSLLRLGRPGSGDFLGLWQRDGGARIAMGRVLVSGEFEAAVVASAAFALVREEMRIGESGFARANEIFHFKFWDLVTWEPSRSSIEIRSFRFGQAEPTCRSVRIEDGRPLALHSLDAEWARRLELYLRILKGLEGRRLMQELTGILKEPAAGGVIILQTGDNPPVMC